MSRLFGRPLRGLLVVFLVLSVSPGAMAQDRDDNGEQIGAHQREMISTGLDSQTIAREWPDAAVWLDVPDDGRVLVLFEPETGSRVKGALIILADEAQSAASGLAGAIRRPLARAGWAVLSVGLEPAPYAVQQARRQQDSPPADNRDHNAGAGEEESASVMIDVMDSVDVDELEERYLEGVQETLAAAVAYLSGRDYETVALAGIGRGSSHVTRLAVEGGDVAAMVWIAAEFDRDQSAELPEQVAAAGSLSVLDLHSSRWQSESDARSPVDRAAAFRRAGVERYTRQPVAVSDPPEARDAPALANRISAWLESVQ